MLRPSRAPPPQGIIGGTPDVRSIVIPVCLAVFLCGFLSFLYSKWIEQGSIRDGALAVKRVLDDEVNPKYADHPHKLRYTVRVLASPPGGRPLARRQRPSAASAPHAT